MDPNLFFADRVRTHGYGSRITICHGADNTRAHAVLKAMCMWGSYDKSMYDQLHQTWASYEFAHEHIDALCALLLTTGMTEMTSDQSLSLSSVCA